FFCCAIYQKRCRAEKLAGMAGLEPANEGVKVPCLTTWLHPNTEGEEFAGAGWNHPTPPNFLGRVKGLEPSASRATIWRANQLRHTHHSGFRWVEPWKETVIRPGRKWYAWRDLNPRPTA